MLEDQCVADKQDTTRSTSALIVEHVTMPQRKFAIECCDTGANTADGTILNRQTIQQHIAIAVMQAAAVAAGVDGDGRTIPACWPGDDGNVMIVTKINS